MHLSLQQDFTQLLALDPDADATAIAEQAHKILSAARMLEAQGMMAACEALEQSGLPASQVKLRRQILARHMRRVEKALARQLATA
ncbi:Hpt domain protein [compost metagenome]